MSSEPPGWDALLARLEADLSFGEAAGRDEAAWLLLTERLRSMAEALLRRYGPLKTSDAGDLAQDVLLSLQAPDGLRKLRAAKAPEGYLVVLLRNRIIDRLRRERSERRRDDHLSEAAGPSDPTPEERLALRIALETLSEADRQLLEMRFWENRSIQSIADELGINYSAAAVRLFRLLRRLQTHLES